MASYKSKVKRGAKKGVSASGSNKSSRRKKGKKK